MNEITSVIQEGEGGKRLHLSQFHLIVVNGPNAGLKGEFDHDVVRIGSSTGNHIQLSDSTVSRNHAEVARTPHGVLLRDLDSTNGTFVGPVRIREVYLGEQRRFRVGMTDIDYKHATEVIDITPSEATVFEGQVGISVSMREMFSVLERVADTELTVLITGETGTGKELASRAMHNRSRRKNGPFVVFDCGAVARNLLESELFGHERGAFTGAVASRAGVFEQANGGTIFLDELGELPLDLQPALLRVLEQREVRRVGDRRVRPIDVRIVAATNRHLRKEVEKNRFREDLYYRVAVVEVALPPLRERREDFSLLIKHLLQNAPISHQVRGVSDEVESVFQAYRWPGNVRELRNVLLRAIPFCDGEIIGLESLPDAFSGDPDEDPTDHGTGQQVLLPGADLSLKEAKDQLLDAFERKYLEDLLERCSGNLSQAARMAGVDRKTVARMLKRHGIR
jgi:DNA-binding NtrC family response regulator